jgi:hypothetical protein
MSDEHSPDDEGREETTAESLAVLRRDGLIEWNGQYRNGQPVRVATTKGRRLFEGEDER